MTEMERTGMCSHCRQPVEGLVFVPVTPLRPKRLKTHQDEPEPEGFYQSVQEFLQQATLHRTASEAPGPPARPRSPLSALPFEPSMTFAGARPGYVFMLPSARRRLARPQLALGQSPGLSLIHI